MLSVFERVFVGRKLSEAEEGRLTGAVTDSDVRERIIRTGLGEYVGAAERIKEALELGPSVSPAGYALVLGAADWRLAGVNAPVPASVLPALAAPHLAARDRADLADRHAYEEALGWATRETTQRLHAAAAPARSPARAQDLDGHKRVLGEQGQMLMLAVRL